MRALLALPLITALAACNTTSDGESPVPVAQPQQVAAAPPETGKPPKPAAIAAIKATAAKTFKDPPAAKWERMQQATRPDAKGEPTEVVCGYVNAKNSFGGYIGPKPFAFLVKTGDLFVLDEGDGPAMKLAGVHVIERFCTGLI